MAYLIDPLEKFKVYLRPYHCFGRKVDAGYSRVDTTIDDRTVSRQHAFIEHINACWTLRDTSLNGVLVNGQPLEPNRPYQLKLNDQITFGTPEFGYFTVADLSAPQPFLLPRFEPKQSKCSFPVPYSTACYISQSAFFLREYQLFPNDEQPEISIHQDFDKNCWMCEHLQTGQVQKLNNGGILWLQEGQWQVFFSLHLGDDTQAITASEQQNPLPEFLFRLSQDEESTELNIRHNGEKYDLGVRTHHYLLVLLARKRLEDIKAGQSSEDSGWLYRSQLAKMLGVESNHLNILLHRARKQLSSKAENSAALSVLELKDRQVRFGEAPLSIHKGSKLEVSYAPN